MSPMAFMSSSVKRFRGGHRGWRQLRTMVMLLAMVSTAAFTDPRGPGPAR